MTKSTHLENLLQRRPELKSSASAIEKLIGQLVDLYRNERVLLVAGNGGSGADADHICGELLKGFKSRRELEAGEKAAFESRFGEDGAKLANSLQKGLRAVSLLSHPALLSAFANDVDPDLVYAQQLYALGRPGDMFLGISTGGNAVNIRCALMAARVKGIGSVLLTGNRHGSCEKYADLVVAVPESETYLVQEMHLSIYHTVCLEVEEQIFGGK